MHEFTCIYLNAYIIINLYILISICPHANIIRVSIYTHMKTVFQSHSQTLL